MALKHFLAALVFCVAVAPSRPAQAQTESAGQAPASAGAMGAVPHDPAVVAKLKKAAEAQGEISPYTLKALERDPKAMEVVGRAPASHAGGQPAGNASAGPKSAKAMYGDIIIHK